MPATQDDANNVYAAEWRARVNSEFEEVGRQFAEVSRQFAATAQAIQTTSLSVERLDGRMSTAEAAIKSMQHAPESFRNWFNSISGVTLSLLTLLTGGCGCMTLLSAIGIIVGIITALAPLLHK